MKIEYYEEGSSYIWHHHLFR